MIEEKNEDRQSFDQDAVMVYIDPQLMQGLADVAAQKAANFQELLSAAQEGDLESAYQVALSYANGRGTSKDSELAFQWFQRAADGDHIAAQYQLGVCFLRGIGTEADIPRGLELITSTADQDYLPSVCELGLCYEMGTGVEESKERAPEL